ncbi:hypothetical protein O6H91_17G048300 [Diphasiastrum complanatum]|uniref:Uncharacterized protein n=1 Tax=Diphasiastrum complanatum TaxID=34168 RepID=A0ACC2B6K0_DIPCM|nr:hypothetical protein O6H91_17G048300 [Diphasiastrum complanatum]
MQIRISLGRRTEKVNGCGAHARVAKMFGFMKWVELISTVSFVLLLFICDSCTASDSSFNEKADVLSGGTPDGRGLQVERSPLVQDVQALISLKTVLMLANPHISSSPLVTWEQNATDSCNWEGVQCTFVSGVIRVTSLDLSNSTLMGDIPAQLFNLTALVSLSLKFNRFSGNIPSAFGNLSSLNDLDLSNNSLNGKIPESFLNLINLQYLNMAGNQLTGGIPDALTIMCGDLKILNISKNPNLGGQLPLGILACKNLTVLDLELSNLQGYVPVELGQIPGLQFLNLGGNNFTGPLPDELFSSCSSLSHMDLSLNHLIGRVPPAIGNCSALSVLMLSQNHLTSIPVELSQLTNLTWLFLGQNQIVGEIPTQITNLVSLTILDLRANEFSGNIPPALGHLKFLQYLMLENNNFSGSLPTEIAMLSDLIYLDVSDNLLGGAIPDFLQNLTSMQFLFLANNSYSGYIPPELGYLPNLQVLDLGDNKLTGNIPNTIGYLHSLLWLRLANNRLSGPIPHEIGNCSSLMWLNLFNNSLSGPIPESIGLIGRMSVATFASNSKNLLYLPIQLGECNMFLRWLPDSEYPFNQYPAVLPQRKCNRFWNRIMTGDVILPICKNQSRIAENGYIQMSMNMLSGSLPMSLSETYHHNAIFMSDNNISGVIPDIFNRPGLAFLRLHNNLLTGPIPYDLSQMNCVDVMDLSFNNLSGSIPDSLEYCSALTVFNVSYNPLLCGPIPVGGQLLTFPSSSYLGDNLLCYLNDYELSDDCKMPICKSSSPTQTQGPPSSASRPAGPETATVIGIILVCASGVVAIIVIGICFVRRSAFSNAASSLVVDLKESACLGDNAVQVSLFSTELPRQLKYTDLLMATSNFDEANIISKRGFTVVYKATLMDGSLVAIKKIIQQDPLADLRFLAVIESISQANQENIVPILGCSVIGSEKLLVYKYMVNGSLDDCLHERPGGKKALNWPRRLKIAIGMATGLKFLHHNCSPIIIHGNMKSSNVLLDERFEPRLTDFGLAEALNGSETHVSSIVVANVGYLPPEYGQTWRATIEGDVYSFGVVLLELITGRRPVDVAYSDQGCRNIAEWVKTLRQDGKEEDVYDPVVTLSRDPEELLKLLELATRCTHEVFVKRPSMQDVLEAFEEV